MDRRAVLQEASGADKNPDNNKILKEEYKRLKYIIDGENETAEARETAQTELTELWKKAKKESNQQTRMAESVRKALKRLRDDLANSFNDKHEPNHVLRDFANHLDKCLIIPSSRFNNGQGSRNRAGVAGKFTYEPPSGVVWTD